MSDLVRILNTQPQFLQVYEDAVSSWPPEEPIWPHLDSNLSRLELVKYIGCNNPIKHIRYVSGKESERSGTRPFNCAHFSRMMYLSYTENSIDDITIAQGYSLSRVPPSLRLPISEVAVIFPRPLPGDSLGHAINAVYLGGERENVDNWGFIEPQNGQLLFRSPFDKRYELGTYFIALPHNDMPLDSKYGGDNDLPDDTPAFRIRNDGKVISTAVVHSTSTMGAIARGDDACLLMSLAYGHPGEFKRPILELALSSGVFSEEGIRNIRDYSEHCPEQVEPGQPEYGWRNLAQFLLLNRGGVSADYVQQWYSEQDRRHAAKYLTEKGVLIPSLPQIMGISFQILESIPPQLKFY